MTTRTPTHAGLLAENARLLRCITAAMGCLHPMSASRDKRLAWLRLHDALNGKEPRDKLTEDENR